MYNKKKNIKNRCILSALIIIGVGLLSSCQSHKKADVDATSSTPPVVVVPDTGNADVTQCKSPRSPMCTREYRPVCASKDTGLRCVTTPCPSTETVTKSNACTACADDKVSSYIDGACS